MNRRDLLKTMATGVAVGSLPLTAAAAPPVTTPVPDVPPGEAPWWLLAPLNVGDEVAFGWHLADLTANDRGAWVLSLTKGSRVLRAHLCYHEGSPRGVAYSSFLDVVLMDGGDGGKPTDETLGRVLRHISQLIRQNELCPGAEDELSRLLTHGERVSRFGPETLF